jgi:hypothetical protein
VNAADLATSLNARPTGAGRWMARCPAHSDRAPSLSITAGDDARVLLFCFAGCKLPEILTSIGLHIRDLFPRPPLSPEKVSLLRREREAREAASRVESRESRELWDRVRQWRVVGDALGDKLAYTPDDEAHSLAKAKLAGLFHRALERHRDLEMDAEARDDRRMQSQRQTARDRS